MRKKYTNLITSYLNEIDIQYFVAEVNNEEDDLVLIPLNFAKVPAIIVKAFISETGKIAFMAKLGTAANEGVKKELYSVLNSLNNRYSFVSFSLNESDAIYASLHFIVDDKTDTEIVGKYFGAITSICEASVQEILPILWDEDRFMGQDESYNDDEDESYEYEDDESYEYEFHGYPDEPDDEDDSYEVPDDDPGDDLAYKDEFEDMLSEFGDLFTQESSGDDSDDDLEEEATEEEEEQINPVFSQLQPLTSDQIKRRQARRQILKHIQPSVDYSELFSDDDSDDDSDYGDSDDEDLYDYSTDEEDADDEEGAADGEAV